MEHKIDQTQVDHLHSCAKRVNEYWRERGHNVNARVERLEVRLPRYVDMKGKVYPALTTKSMEIVSDLVNGLPQ